MALKPLIPDSFRNMLPTIVLRCCYNVTQKGVNRDFFRSISCLLPTISTAMLSCKVSAHFFRKVRKQHGRNSLCVKGGTN